MNPKTQLGLPGLLASVLLLAACGSAPIAAPSVSGPAAVAISTDPAPANETLTQPTPAARPAVAKLAPYLDPDSPLHQHRSVYFDFDQSIVKTDYARSLQLHGQFLAANPALKIRIEGNTDEQGGTEYNLALGQKRAEAVLKALKLYGASDTQLEAISFGKEKPKAGGHDDASRAQNRRADLAYPAP